MKKQEKDCYDLWKQCFGDSDLYMKYYFQEKLKDNQILTLYEGDKLTSMLHLNPYELSMDGNILTANYIVGVATDQEYRKQGRMRILLKEAFAKLYQSGQGFTYLMPADEKIYSPFDFRFIYQQNRIRLEEVKKWEHYDLQVAEMKFRTFAQPMDIFNDKELDTLVDYTNKKLQVNFDLYTTRSTEYYIRLQKEMKAAGGNVVLFYHRNNIIGVLAYMKEDTKVEVVEAILESDFTTQIMADFINFIFEDKEEQLQLEFLESYFLDQEYFKSKPGVVFHNKPIIMARIIHLHAFVEMLKWKETFQRIIKVEDELIEENNGIWKITCSPEKNAVERSEEPFEVCMTIYELMEFLLVGKKVYINEIV